MADKEMGDAERALRKATGVRDKNFKKRQDYLAALAKGCDKLSDEDFEALDDDASDWANKALESLKAKEEIDDFEGAEEADADEEDEKPAKKGKASKKDADEDEDEKPSKKSKKAAKDEDEDEDEKPAKKSKDGAKRKSPRDYEGAKRDKFGLVVGTKVSDAVKLFEKGATMKTIKDKTGGPQNNVLKKLAKDGHLVERYDGMIKVTHKDDLDSKQKAKVTKAKNKAAADVDEDEDEKPAKKDKAGKKSKKDDDADEEDEKPSKKAKKRVRDDDDE